MKDRQCRAAAQDILRRLQTSVMQNQLRTEEGLDRYLDMLRACELTEDTAKVILLRLHFQEADLTLVRIADSMFVSASYLSNLFRKETGMSVTEFILECRMQKAARLIEKAQDCTLAVIAEQCGYNDPYYFSRIFKKYYGISPAKYKDQSGL